MNGRVTLLGAGPGNPELLTLIGKRRLNEADVVLKTLRILSLAQVSVLPYA